MKKTIRLMSFVLILLVLTSIFPLAGFAYGTDDSKLIVTHLNTSSPGGHTNICVDKLVMQFMKHIPKLMKMI